MPTEASLRALEGMRDLSMLQGYVIPLLAIVFSVYTHAIQQARITGEWGANLAGATVFGMDFLNETILRDLADLPPGLLPLLCRGDLRVLAQELAPSPADPGRHLRPGDARQRRRSRDHGLALLRVALGAARR